ncbi:hypothetical protein E1301_Tti019900 [Triplophysa tibetana]|uniref:Protein FAM216A n=1 Tax=Triplophysa tibetana TaxID=1572043 RepID=A0A5A9PGW7_9TELE|nr:hypothetical protein E1301_Tti019900 [Triplophysa tibetana]
MTDAPFLQHPALTPGQKRFLYSIAEAYSKDHMRQLIWQHYMNVLHRCIRTDLNPHVKPKVTTTYRKESVTAQAEHITLSRTLTIFGTKEHGRKLVIKEKAKKTTLPKITSHQRRISGMSFNESEKDEDFLLAT